MRVFFVSIILLFGCSSTITPTPDAANAALTATLTATNTPTQTATPTNTPVSPIAADLLMRINLLRQEADLTPYHFNDALMKAAQMQAEWMVQTGEVMHIHPDGSSPAKRADAAGYPNPASCSENIYMGGIANEDYAWDFWIHSKIHHAGLVSPWHDEIGIGTAHSDEHGQSFVLVFGASGAPWPTRPPITVTIPGGTAQPVITATAAAPTATIDSTYTTYVVQPGDTLFQIALRFGTSVDKLAAANGITNPDRIEVGQVLIIP
jgi:uncharacterized protein YkwD